MSTLLINLTRPKRLLCQALDETQTTSKSKLGQSSHDSQARPKSRLKMITKSGHDLIPERLPSQGAVKSGQS